MNESCLPKQVGLVDQILIRRFLTWDLSIHVWSYVCLYTQTWLKSFRLIYCDVYKTTKQTKIESVHSSSFQTSFLGSLNLTRVSYDMILKFSTHQVHFSLKQCQTSYISGYVCGYLHNYLWQRFTVPSGARIYLFIWIVGFFQSWFPIIRIGS